LITPLAAYLRLREHGRASFLLESVDRGRLGRYSLVGCGSRLVDVAEAEASGEAVVGYVGYDWVAQLEPTVPLPAAGPDDLPESRFVVADVFVRFDHVTGTAEVLRGDPDAVAELLGAPVEAPVAAPVLSGPTVRFPDQAEHERRVEVAKEHIRQGDAFQVVLSQRAEREMLVDLGRNDLSRVCRPGTVKVERFLEPEQFSHVTHLVSEVAGELYDGVSPFELLRATFPAGTVSGAPKVRAMQIISELE